MVDNSAKPNSVREATASARVHTSPDVVDALLQGTAPKGDAVGIARTAGILAAKKTSDIIPLCHTLGLAWVQVDITRQGPDVLLVTCTARTSAPTGVEMEAMVGASVAALTLYDMGKALDKSIVVGPIQLERKSGGKSGDYRRSG